MATPVPATVGQQFTAEQATQLLDFSQKMDIAMLDAVVTCFYNSVGSQVHIVLFFASIKLL